MPTFCRHNRFFAECPICSKGTVLDPSRSAARRPRTSPAPRSTAGTKRPAPGAALTAVRTSRGEYASAGPYDGAEIRLERVPGGLRMAAWRGGQIERAAPVIAAADAPALLADAAQKQLLSAPPPDGHGDGAAQVGAFGASPGRTGELRDELRVERLEDGRVRVARWILRPNRGWQLQEAPVMLPPARFAQALSAAAAQGVLVSGGPAE